MNSALSLLQRRVTGTVAPPPPAPPALERHASAPPTTLSPVREAVEPNDAIDEQPTTPRSAPAAKRRLARRRRGSVETPKNTPRRISASDIHTRSPGDYTVLLKSKARLRRALTVHAPLDPAHRRSLTPIFRTERSWSVPRRPRGRSAYYSAPNSPVFGPSSGATSSSDFAHGCCLFVVFCHCNPFGRSSFRK